MSFSKNFTVSAALSVVALSFATAGLAHAGGIDRSDNLGLAIAAKDPNTAQLNTAVATVKNVNHDRGQGGIDRSDNLGLAIAVKDQVPAQSNTALASAKKNAVGVNQGSNQSGQ